MQKAYSEKLVGSVPEFPPEIERSITLYLNPVPVETGAEEDASLARIFR
jgi:hypothetical protein